MGTCNNLLLLTYATFFIIHLVKSQSQQGFISLDCGLPSNESPYNESFTSLTFISDADFIQGGKTGNIQETLSILKPYRVLRYFPDGVRNCFSLNVTQNTNYLIRTVFVYGNYDGLNSPPGFDLYLGPNIWTSLDLGKSDSNEAFEEIFHITRSNRLDICVVKTGTSTPLISTIELRPLPYHTYTTQTGSLKNLQHLYFSNSNRIIRYPKDVYDRNWFPYFLIDWTQINTTLNVNDSSNGYAPPQDVIRTAAIPTNASEPFTFQWDLKSSDDELYAYLYFAEIQQLRGNETREFKVMANGKVDFDSYSPKYFKAEAFSNPAPLKCEGAVCRVQLFKTPQSTLPPLMNAIEIFSIIHFPQSETNNDDVVAIKNIQSTYQLSRISWQGDPCVPKQFSWTGLTCNVIDTSTPPRIITLDLSSSGLSGAIPPSIQNLSELRELDLSNNNLTGEVPEFLAKIKPLLVINLRGNNLRGSVPQALAERRKDGLKLLVDENIKVCVTCGKKFPYVAVLASVSSVAIIIIVLVLIFYLRRRKPSAGIVTSLKKRSFTYSEVKEMTSNFQVTLGKGGFGVVYQASINKKQAAVKVLSPLSAQGYKEFKAEVELLLRVHHGNLVSLIGYCDDGNDLALIYELMENGNLKEHLSGELGGPVLSWESRLNIAVESAQGIEYLHTGCDPQIVHRDIKSTNILLGRDIKSTNILLGGKMKAKLADFGLSRSFPIGNESEVSTNAAGTFGYLDPEYFQHPVLSKTCDVYSFGVVLLEIISSQPVIQSSRGQSNIVEWAKTTMLENGDIENIVDPKLHQEYDKNSAWKALELAISCVNIPSEKRPNMSQVVHELNECLKISEKWRKRRNQDLQTRSSTELSITVDTEMYPKAR